MKKKFLLGTIIPALAAVAVIGSGFSMWYFGDANSVSATQTANKNVEQLVRVGKITAADNFTVNFDQTQLKHAQQIGSATTDVEATGITLKFAKNANTKAIYTEASKTTFDDNLAGLDHTDDDKVYYVFTTKVTIENGLGAYVNMNVKTGSKFEVNHVEGETTEKTTVYTFTSQHNVNVFDWSNVELTYADGKEPSTLAEFKVFHDLVNNEATKISVVYAVDVYAK